MKHLSTAIACSLALLSSAVFATSHKEAPDMKKTAASAPAPMAAGGNCASMAADKKLAGAAKSSYMKKCERDMGTTTCTTQATEKKLAGAAKNSFMKKCETDAMKPA